MITKMNTPRLLGLMFIVVIILSVISGIFLTPLNYSMTGPPDNISETMINFSANPAKVQLSITGFLIEAASIVFLAVLLFAVLKEHNRVIARWAYGLWILEAVFVAIRQINAFSLLYTSQGFVQAGAPSGSYFQTMGSLFYRLMQFSYDVQMVFYCIGGFLFYYLFFKSKFVPAWLSIFGIVVASLGFVGELLVIFGNVVPLYFFLPILPFELAIGLWLIIKGVRDPKAA